MYFLISDTGIYLLSKICVLPTEIKRMIIQLLGVQMLYH